MPGQVVDVDSILLNTAGVAVAHLLVVPVCRVRLRRGDRVGTGDLSRFRHEAGTLGSDAPQGATPRISRVGIAP